MPGVLTTVGASKVGAAKAASKKVIIAKIVLGTIDAVASASTTTIGTEDKVQNRVHIVKGIKGDSVSFSGMIELDSVSRRRLVGVYDSDGDLIAVERITIPIVSDTIKHYILSVTLTNYADSGIFDNSISYTSSFMSRQEAARIHRQSVDQVRVGMPSAQEGQLIRHTGSSGREGGWILEEAMIVDNANDLALARNTIVPMTEVFNTWYRFSHGNGNPPTYPRLPAELDGWKMVGDILEGTINSSSLIGFISPNKVLDFKFEVTVSSTSGDDDVGGLVIAFNISEGIEHCLSILRSPGGWPDGYQLWYNRNQFNAQLIYNGNSMLKWGNGNFGTTPAEAGYAQTAATSWSGLGRVRLRVEREGDIIRCWSSDWGQSELLSSSKIEINMGNFPVLAPLRKPASYGYANWSQPAMRYETHEMTQPSQTILDLRDGKFYTYQNGGWVVQSTISGNTGSMFKPNRFIYSPINKRTYFTNAAGIPFRVI